MKLWSEEDVEELRDIVGACNQTTLTRVATDYFKSNFSTKDGNLKIKEVAELLKEKRDILELERARERVKALEAKTKKG